MLQWIKVIVATSVLELEGLTQWGPQFHLHNGLKPEPAGGTEERWSQ